jgi:response regulator RpfG family c-di-GMP phosphodiesterase
VAVIRRAGLLHDLGKLMVLDTILLKPGPLTPEELAVVRRHPVVGGRILRRLRHFEREAEAVEHHLERYDGTGHPDAQRGEAIPLAARIVAITDAFDAMTSPRPYRQPQSLEAALDEVGREAGGQFDPRFVEAFVGLPAARLREISRYYRNPPALPEADSGADQPSYFAIARGHHDPLEALRSALAGGLGWVRLIETPREDEPR